MSNARNLANLLNTDTTIATGDVADGGISTAKLADDAVTSAKLDTNIAVAGTLGVTGQTTLSDKLTINFNGSGSQAFKFKDTGGGNLASFGQFYNPSDSLMANIQNANNDGIHIMLGNNGSLVFDQTGYNATNALDDYEEGTWTPATSSSSYNTGSSTGLYTKIGRIVIAHFSINFSGVNSSSNAIVAITNFPFTNGGAIASAGSVRESSNTGAVYVTRIGTNTTTATMNSMDNVTNGSQRTIRTGEDYVGTLIYVT